MTKPLSDTTITLAAKSLMRVRAISPSERYGDSIHMRNWKYVGAGIYRYVGPPFQAKAIQRSMEEG